MQKNMISFVVQGAIDGTTTRQCLNAIRQYFPDSPIILSTWKGSDVTGLDYDKLVLSDDPGFFFYSKRSGEKQNNVNRQIVSSLEGLKQATTEFAFKIRTDFILNGDSVVEYWDKFTQSDEAYKVFDSKILSCCYFSRNPALRMPFPFHPSDLAFLGKTQDLINLFDIPLLTEREAYWNESDKLAYRYTPEQHIFINCLRKNNRDVACDYYRDNSAHNIAETEKYFASNFVFLTFTQFCLTSPKKTFSMNVHPNAFRSCYTHHEWISLYKKHVDATAIVPAMDEERLRIEQCYKNARAYRLLGNIMAVFCFNKGGKRRVRNAVLEYFLHA